MDARCSRALFAEKICGRAFFKIRLEDYFAFFITQTNLITVLYNRLNITIWPYIDFTL